MEDYHDDKANDDEGDETEGHLQPQITLQPIDFSRYVLTTTLI